MLANLGNGHALWTCFLLWSCLYAGERYLRNWIWNSAFEALCIIGSFCSPSPPHGMDQCNLSTSPLESMMGRKVSRSFIACQSFGMQLKAAVKIKMACICYFLVVQVDNPGKNYSSSIFSSKALLIMTSYFLMVQRSYANSSNKLGTLTGSLEGYKNSSYKDGYDDGLR